MKTPPDNNPKPLSGIWRSDVVYQSESRGGEFETHNYMRVYPKGGELVFESVKGVNDSYLVARFWVDGDVATGSWQEVTSQEGHYKGAIYHGAGQVIIDKERKHLKGKWIGFGQHMQVKTGPWELVYLGEDESAIEKDKPNYPTTGL